MTWGSTVWSAGPRSTSSRPAGTRSVPGRSRRPSSVTLASERWRSWASTTTISASASSPLWWQTVSTRDAIDGFLAGVLTTHKRPREIRFVDSLPRNSMGKVQKSKLI